MSILMPTFAAHQPCSLRPLPHVNGIAVRICSVSTYGTRRSAAEGLTNISRDSAGRRTIGEVCRLSSGDDKTHENNDRTHRRQSFEHLRLDDGLDCWWVLSRLVPLGPWGWASPSTYRRWLILVFSDFCIFGFSPFSGANPPPHFGG